MSCNNYNYRSIQDFGPNTFSQSNNPLSYCLVDGLDQRFIHGGNSDAYDWNSKRCQVYMAEYCSTKWDNFCDAAASRRTGYMPSGDFSAGEIFLRNTAERKYLVKMIGGTKKYESFDPTVGSSPMISYWEGGIPIYEVNPNTIDSDIVMNKILDNQKAILACQGLFINIYNTMKKKGNLSKLKNTRLGQFYKSQGLNV
jgi:hypothetical protein